MTAPKYDCNPIGSVRSLARALRISEKDLRSIAANSQRYYQPNKPDVKPNGGIRQTYTVGPKLKLVQEQIVKEIFHRITFPDYVQGSVKSRGESRDYITDASLHAGSHTILKYDITNFFDSIKVPFVRNLWQHFFNFPPNVADLLTKLTTYNGSVPQGAPTSSYIANLILWKDEPWVERRIRNRGFRYSRYVDDVTVSEDSPIPEDIYNLITADIETMLKKVDLQSNKTKRKIVTKSEPMRVHGLNVNSGRPTLPKKKRGAIRAAVRQCELMAALDPSSDEYRRYYNSVLGRVSIFVRLHPRPGKKLRQRLDAIRPIIE